MPAPKRMHWEEKYLINTYEIFVVISMNLRPCRNHLNPNMMLAKNLLWNNLMYVLINSSPSNFFFYDIETISIRGRIKLMSCQHL